MTTISVVSAQFNRGAMERVSFISFDLEGAETALLEGDNPDIVVGMAEWTIAPALKAGGLWPPGFESQSHRILPRATSASGCCDGGGFE